MLLCQRLSTLPKDNLEYLAENTEPLTEFINTALKKTAGSCFARWTFLLRVNSLFSVLSFPLAICIWHKQLFSAASVSCCELSLSLLCQTSGLTERKSICHCMTSNTAAFYFHEATKDLQLRPSLTNAELLNYMIKGCHSESMKAAQWYRFPSGH